MSARARHETNATMTLLPGLKSIGMHTRKHSTEHIKTTIHSGDTPFFTALCSNGSENSGASAAGVTRAPMGDATDAGVPMGDAVDAGVPVGDVADVSVEVEMNPADQSLPVAPPAARA